MQNFLIDVLFLAVFCSFGALVWSLIRIILKMNTERKLYAILNDQSTFNKKNYLLNVDEMNHEVFLNCKEQIITLLKSIKLSHKKYIIEGLNQHSIQGQKRYLTKLIKKTFEFHLSQSEQHSETSRTYFLLENDTAKLMNNVDELDINNEMKIEKRMEVLEDALNRILKLESEILKQLTNFENLNQQAFQRIDRIEQKQDKILQNIVLQRRKPSAIQGFQILKVPETRTEENKSKESTLKKETVKMKGFKYFS